MSTNVSPRKCFLVVDDEPLIRMDIVDLIQEHGFVAWEASNVAEALSILDKAGADFTGLITDVNMPGSRNGMVLANHVRTMWPHIRIVVVSAGRKPMAGELPENTAFVPKPWEAHGLIQAIGNFH
ncbi:Response regulator receiver domain-containing protein [Devosia lucknowensis]|uniref:Response regulator receiver domain-containing protein n=1 Tax=Devosia lucknowensis TaxID=1096929 RepID=A0A1Y6FGW9_9HYPH|nr:response regulator [Devosia lucknowensis]SMQ72132.1 Response regulator receiver domain-containing protein [Devosia lucknowensis]